MTATLAGQNGHRLPPQSLDAEQAVLGAALISRDAIETLLSGLKPEDFYLDAHRRIYDVIFTLHCKDHAVDVLTVPEELRRRGQLDIIGGVAYINTLAESVPTAAHQAFYVEEVLRPARSRALIEEGQIMVRNAFDDFSPDDIIAHASATFAGLERGLAGHDETSARELFRRRRAQQHDNSPPDYLPLRFPVVDDVMKVHSTDFVIVAARPSMGKTALMLAFVFKWACIGHHVDLFTLEMSEDQIADRMIAAMAEVPLTTILEKQLNAEEQELYDNAAIFLEELPISFHDRSSYTVREIRSTLMRNKREKDTKVAIIDQLSFLQASRDYGTDKNGEYAEIARDLKRVAKDLKVRTFLLHQLNREVEKRTNKRPLLSDLRASGAIEEDADIVLLAYRDNYYAYAARGEKEPAIGTMEVRQAKGRMSGDGLMKLQFNRDTQLITALNDYGPDEEDAPPAHLTPDPLLVQQALFDRDLPADYANHADWSSRI